MNFFLMLRLKFFTFLIIKFFLKLYWKVIEFCTSLFEGHLIVHGFFILPKKSLENEEKLLRRKKVVNKNHRCCEDDAMKIYRKTQWHTFTKRFSDIQRKLPVSNNAFCLLFTQWKRIFIWFQSRKSQTTWSLCATPYLVQNQIGPPTGKKNLIFVMRSSKIGALNQNLVVLGIVSKIMPGHFFLVFYKSSNFVNLTR